MAAVDFFLDIKGVKGESTDAKHKDQIDIESWNWGATQQGTSGRGGGAGAGKVSMHDLTFAMRHNKSSPTLMLACATGEHFPTAVLYARKAGKDQQEYFNIALKDVLVSSYHTGGSNGGSDVVPLDEVTLNFGVIEMEYKPQKPDGALDAPVKTGYDVTKNQKV